MPSPKRRGKPLTDSGQPRCGRLHSRGNFGPYRPFMTFAANGSKGAKSPMVIGIVEEAHDDHVVVVTRDKFKRKLTSFC